LVAQCFGHGTDHYWNQGKDVLPIVHQKVGGWDIDTDNQIYFFSVIALVEEVGQGLALGCVAETGKIEVFGKELYAELGLLGKYIVQSFFHHLGGREATRLGIENDYLFLLFSCRHGRFAAPRCRLPDEQHDQENGTKD